MSCIYRCPPLHVMYLQMSTTPCHVFTHVYHSMSCIYRCPPLHVMYLQMPTTPCHVFTHAHHWICFNLIQRTKVWVKMAGKDVRVYLHTEKHKKYWEKNSPRPDWSGKIKMIRKYYSKIFNIFYFYSWKGKIPLIELTKLSTTMTSYSSRRSSTTVCDPTYLQHQNLKGQYATRHTCSTNT